MPDFTDVRFDNSKRKARSVKTLPKALFFVRLLNNPHDDESTLNISGRLR